MASKTAPPAAVARKERPGMLHGATPGNYWLCRPPFSPNVTRPPRPLPVQYPTLKSQKFWDFSFFGGSGVDVTLEVAMAGRLSHGLLATLMLMASVMANSLWSAEGRSVPALFIFGDSIVDVGNNNFLPRSTARADFPHNGVDFPGGRPTGRFSNGYNAADYLAKEYGFKRSPPPFLSLTKSQLHESICRGINFASAGSGILNTTGSSLGVIPMDVQLEYFRSSLQSFRPQKCLMARRTLLSKSIFLFSTGSNDLFALYSSTNLTTSEFITAMTSKQKQQLRMLYRLGARRFGVMGLGLIGCCPALRRLTPSGGCLAALNDYALQFNLALREALGELRSKCEGMKYSFGDGQNLAKLIADSPAYGFKESQSACCGGGRLNGESPCTPNATLCSNRDDYYFGDWLHPTARAAKLTVELLHDGPPTLASPINFGELADD